MRSAVFEPTILAMKQSPTYVLESAWGFFIANKYFLYQN
jgi:hypothetical protein